MKKYFFLISVAALAMTACTNESEEYVGSQESREIAFSPLNQNATRAAVEEADFPTTSDIQVAAYDVTNSRDFFDATTFRYENSKTYSGDASAKNYWTGGKYWPLSPTSITFLGYTNFQGTSGSETDGATWAVSPATAKASGVTLVMTDNMTAQKDLMYAIGEGAVTQSGNDLTFPKNVPMEFIHAQAWISFYADAYDATSGGKVRLNSITLNGASYSGTYTITHANYDNPASNSVSGVWTALGNKGTDSESAGTSIAENVTTPNTKIVPNWTPAAVAYDGSGNGVAVGDGLLIVPDDNDATADFVSFTINYTLDGNTYNYTYTPATAAAANVDQKKHYIYNINFHLHEIEITPTVLDWSDQTPVDVPIF